MTGRVAMGGATDEEGAYKFLGQLFRPGYSQGLAVTQRGAGANMSVDVSAGGAMTVTSAVIAYYGWISATENVTGITSDPGNPRRAIVVAYVDLALISAAVTNNDGAFKFKVVLGTAAGSPVDPSDPTIQSSVGAGNPWTKLARLQIAAGATNIVNADITDLRTPMIPTLPFLYGGSNNVKGHAVPNTSDGAVVVTTEVGQVSAAMLTSSAIALGYQKITSQITTTATSATQAPGLSANVTIPPGGRMIEIEVFAPEFYNSSATLSARLSIWDGAVGSGALLAYSISPGANGGSANHGYCKAIITPPAGGKTYNVGFHGGGGTTTLAATIDAPAFILVKAI